MSETIKNQVISITIWSAIAVIAGVISIVWMFADMRSQLEFWHVEFDKRLTIIETKEKSQQQYLYDLKYDLKEEINQHNDKIDKLYNLLISKEK